MRNKDINEWLLDEGIDPNTAIIAGEKQLFLSDILEKHLKEQFAILYLTETKKAMDNRFEKYMMYEKKNGKIMGVNKVAFELANEAFLLFKELYDINYGSIQEDGNLISIHSGGWSENECLINEFKETAWWHINHKITASGGHYYFNTDFYADKEWKIIKG